MEQLIHSPLLHRVLSWLALTSFFTFVLSLLLIPAIVGLLAPDYFLRLQEQRRHRKPLSLLSVFWLFGKNILGLLLLIAGIAMLFLPGQGLLTILLGILLLSLPGKYRLVNRLISIEGVRRSLNWLRRKGGKLPFLWPQPDNGTP